MKANTRILLLLTGLLVFTSAVRAQVAIGPEAGQPQEFSVLELISNSNYTGGLRLPQLTTGERDNLVATPEFQTHKTGKALGLTIYNKEVDCIEFWNGTQWISTCTGEVCPAPEMPKEILFEKPDALKLNQKITIRVISVPDMTYTWTIPDGLVLDGTSANDNPITLRAVTPGRVNLYNIGVTATNHCGNTSASRSGSGYLQVLNCETEPQRSDVDTDIITTSLSNPGGTGTGTEDDPYVVEAGTTFTVTYPDLGNGTIKYTWNLDADGSEFFNIVSQGNGTILLTTKTGKEGQKCEASAIGIVASNDCGDGERVSSGIFILVQGTSTCPKPPAPGPITFSTLTVLVGEEFTASVAQQEGVSYTWKIPEGLLIVGDNTGTSIKLKAISPGTINLVGVGVTATNDCGNSSDPTNGAGILTVKDQSSIPAGPGNLQGRTCFDIAFSNSGNNCGEPTGRQSNRTDFANRTEQDPVAGAVTVPYSGVQVYTFTPPAGIVVSNLRFLVDDPSSKAIERYEQKAGNENKLVVYFNSALNQELRGVTRENAWKVHIYAIYTAAGEEKSVKITLSLQDCSCCGAPTIGGGWLNFMCHNLGADENLDPFVYSPGIKGHLYQWGRKSDGHESRTSTKVSGIAGSSELDADGQVQGRKSGQFIMFVYGRYIVSDWRVNSDDNLWKDSEKTVSDPCPPGWKVPSSAQWSSINIKANWNWTTNGYKIGEALFLPAAGSRSARPGTSITSDPESVWPNYPYGYYWSSTGESLWPMQVYVAHQLMFSPYIGPFVDTGGGIAYRNWGQSVRCVEDL